MEFTKEEKELLSNVLSSITVKPMAVDAIQTITLIQSILGKLNER